jgi:hypothetical protein
VLPNSQGIILQKETPVCLYTQCENVDPQEASI